MTVKRVPGYWVRWAEECGPGDTRYHARWIADEEYVRPDEGSVGDALSVKVAAYWSCDVGGRSRVRTSECVVDFGPGETVQELVLERPDPQRPATLAVHLADAWWADRPGGQEICFGFAGAVEAEGGGEGSGSSARPSASPASSGRPATPEVPGRAARRARSRPRGRHLRPYRATASWAGRPRRR